MAKPLVPIGGVPMIERIIAIASDCGMERFTCIINEESADLREFLFTRKLPLSGQIIVRSTPSSMHSLFALAPYLADGLFCLATVDSVFAAQEFHGFIKSAAARQQSDGVLAVTGYIHDEKPLCVALDDAQRILAFSDHAEGYRWATGGLYVFSPNIFRAMDDALASGTVRLRNFLRLLLQRNYRLHGYPFSKIVDVDHSDDIREAELLVADEMMHAQSSASGQTRPQRSGPTS